MQRVITIGALAPPRSPKSGTLSQLGRDKLHGGQGGKRATGAKARDTLSSAAPSSSSSNDSPPADPTAAVADQGVLFTATLPMLAVLGAGAVVAGWAIVSAVGAALAPKRRRRSDSRRRR